MKTTVVALLRGINVGKAKRIAMQDLRSLCVEFGWQHARTALNSGNLVFECDSHTANEAGRRLEAAIAERFSMEVPVIAIGAGEFIQVVNANPLARRMENPSRYLVAFLARPGDSRLLTPLLDRDWTPEELALGDRAAYLWCPAGILKSELPGAVSRTVSDRVTVRNWSTVMRIAGLINSDQ